MQIENAHTTAALVESLLAVESDVREFFAALTPDELVLREGAAWTPAEHLHHLNTAVSAVARGLAIRPWLLRLRYGRPRRPSRTYAQLRDDYRARLSDGAGASGAFVPPRVELSRDAIESRRADLLARWQRVNARLTGALRGWGESNLESVQVPHPILDKITMRELVYFTHYHGGHHIAAAKRRLPRFAQVSA